MVNPIKAMKRFFVLKVIKKKILCNCFKLLDYLKSHVKIVKFYDETFLITFDMHKI